VKVDLDRRRAHEAAYLRMNPKAKVPALGTPDGILTESVAILEYAARRHGDGALLAKPGTVRARARMERVRYLATDIHPLMNRYFHADDFAPRPRCRSRSKARGARSSSRGSASRTRKLHRLLVGRQRADAADFYFAVIARWGRWFDPKATQMPGIKAFLERMSARPAVQRATAREGNTLFS
jgi:glutathione S-transferase